MSVPLSDILSLTKDRQAFSAFLSGYAEARSDAPLPLLGDCMLSQMLQVLADVTVFDHDTPGIVRYRFAGQAIIDRVGVELTGQNMLQFLSEDMRSSVEANTRAMLDRPCGTYARYCNLYGDGRGVETESLTLPVAADDNPDHHLLVALHRVEARNFVLNHKAPSALGTSWHLSHYIDIGFGAPALSPIEEYEQNLSIKEMRA